MSAYGGGVPPNPPAPNLPGMYPSRPQISFDVIGEAWNLFKMQMGAWIVAQLICGIVVFGLTTVALFLFVVPMMAAGNSHGGAANAAMGASLLLSTVAMVAFMIVVTLLMGGLYRMAIKHVRGETVSISDMFSVTDVLGQLIIAAILMGIITGIGYQLCYVPGFIATGLLMFTIPLVVDQRMPAVAALSQSFNMLKDQWLLATLFTFVISLIGSLGFMLCGIGALFTYPIFFLSVALTYRNFMMGGAVPAAPGGPGLYPTAPTDTAPGGYMPQTPQQPPVTEGYMPSAPTTDYTMTTDSTPTTGYTSTTGYTPPPPPMDNPNNPTQGDNNGPTQR